MTDQDRRLSLLAALKFQYPLKLLDLKILAQYGGVELELIGRELEPGRLKDFLQKESNWVHSCEKILRSCQKDNLSILHPFHEDYPKAFLGFDLPPLFLTLRGAPVWKEIDFVAVVGAREPSESTLLWMDAALPQFLKKCPCGIVSGAARGVDQKAHAIAVRLGVPTIAVLPAGISSPYPRDFSKWYDSILKTGGAILSEYAPNTTIQRHHFYHRNRLITWLSRWVLITEARRCSGSLLTAQWALKSGIDLCIVPGHPQDVRYAGTLDLLYDGAHPIRNHHDLCLFHQNVK